MLTVEQAIPFIMGANIGTSVTNTIVAVTQAKDRNQFRRAFGGATVHDMFNWLSVAILLPLEAQFSILYKMSEGFLSLFNVNQNDSADIDFLDAITKPITSRIVQVITKLLYSSTSFFKVFIQRIPFIFVTSLRETIECHSILLISSICRACKASCSYRKFEKL